MLTKDPSPTGVVPGLQKRINYCIRVIQITLGLGGLILTTVQGVKFFTYTPEERGLASVAIGFALGIIFFILSYRPITNKFVTRFARRIPYKSFRIYTYTSAILLTLLFIFLKLGLDSESWRRMSSEGSVSEYGSAIAYLLITFFAYPICKQFWRQNQKLLGACYGCLAFLGFFVGMEEISWGQRLIGFEEPAFWAEHNAQSEFTFHNLSFYQTNVLDQSYVVVGFLGSFSWIALHFLFRKQSLGKLDLSYILPNWPISAFFYPVFVFYLVFLATHGQGATAHDQEHCEFLMSLGILLFVVINFFRQADKPPIPSKLE